MRPDKKPPNPGGGSKAVPGLPVEAFSTLRSTTDGAFHDFLRIYQEALSVREQKSPAQISALLTRADYRTFVLRKNSATVGFSVVFVPDGEDFCLLEYMAIDTAYRNAGLGGILFRRTVDAAFAKSGCGYMLLEVDSDRENSADQPVRKRRQEFYRRLNCQRIDHLPYILPLPGEGPPPRMDLMVYHPDGRPVVRKAQLEHWLQLIYRDVYDCSEKDARITTMLKTVADPITTT